MSNRKRALAIRTMLVNSKSKLNEVAALELSSDLAVMTLLSVIIFNDINYIKLHKIDVESDLGALEKWLGI